MRIVLDTAVLVRALISPLGWCGQIVFERCERFQSIISPAIVAEYLAVLQRPTIVRKYGSPDTHGLRRVLELIDSGIIVEPRVIPPVCRDPADDKILAAARVGNADAIVSEEDLLALERYQGIAIVSAERFLRMIEEEARQRT